MATPNPAIQEQLDSAKQQLAALKGEKRRLFPPNTDPLGSPDRFPGDYTPEQIAKHKQLNAQIDALEQRVDDLQLRLYTK
jgi:outer membrane protein TolC